MEQSFFIHPLDAFFVPGGRAFVDAVEFYPGSSLCYLFVKRMISFVLGVDPDEPGWLEERQLFQGCQPVACMGGYRQTGFLLADRRCFDDLAVQWVQWGFVYTYLDELRFDSIYALSAFGDPALGELSSSLVAGECRQELVIGRGVESSVGPDVDSGGFRKTLEENGVAAEVIRCALQKAYAALFFDLFQPDSG